MAIARGCSTVAKKRAEEISTSIHARVGLVLKSRLLQRLRREFVLDWGGIHGAPHWARVRFNGFRLARENGARPDVVECFALIHDSQRIHDGRDEDHGARAATFARKINRDLLLLDATGLDLLAYACEYHSDGHTEADITIQTCWDADRLDLGRVGIRPHPTKLCTSAAKRPEFLRAAYERSTRRRPCPTDITPSLVV